MRRIYCWYKSRSQRRSYVGIDVSRRGREEQSLVIMVKFFATCGICETRIQHGIQYQEMSEGVVIFTIFITPYHLAFIQSAPLWRISPWSSAWWIFHSNLHNPQLDLRKTPTTLWLQTSTFTETKSTFVTSAPHLEFSPDLHDCSSLLFFMIIMSERWRTSK